MSQLTKIPNFFKELHEFTTNMVELIITEKPSSARKVAEALAETTPTKKMVKKVSYYELTHGNNKIIVASAVGHLFSLQPKEKNGLTYPVFDIEWKETSTESKELKYVNDYITVLKKLSKDADVVTIACDYDIEGEVIGYNIVRYICKRNDAHRMKFSTLTKDELIHAYNNKAPTINHGQAEAGETRHKLDWYYGINLSRALTSSVKAAGAFKIMSIGRVQGPALKLLVEREREIQNFIPKPYWQLRLLGEKGKQPIEAWHKRDKFWEKQDVDAIFSAVKDEKTATVKAVTKKQFQQQAPHPFDLTTLQTEAYRNFKITPKQTLAIAQTLYVAGYISYPRTSSQQLDPKLGLRNILTRIGKQQQYEQFVNELLQQGKVQPNNGKKTDPAHPALYPTGIIPQKLDTRQQKVYDLIVKRFLSTFAPAAERETMTVTLTVNNEPFVARGTRTVNPGWHKFYQPYLTLEEAQLPELKEGDSISIKKLELIDKETQPPKRYTQSSIIRELEKRNLGTKATRADVIDRLFQRGYVEGVHITATTFGVETIHTLEHHAPTIIDEELTRHFEEEMENIREGKLHQQKVLGEAKNILVDILRKFKSKEKEIGKELLKAIEVTREEENTIGPCPTCKEGTLKKMYSKKNKKYFIACDKYPECETTFPLPAGAIIKPTEKTCEQCRNPIILAGKKGKKPQEVCINPKCKSKENGTMKGEGETCDKCGKGTMVVKRSIYGQFLACNQYPKCKNIKK
jgi:DNA topoisomerase-1